MLQSSQLVLGACRVWQQTKSVKSESSEIKDHHSCAKREEEITPNEINSVNSCKTTRNVAGLEKSWKFQKSLNHWDNDDWNQTGSLTSENNVLDICKAPQDEKYNADQRHVTCTDDKIFVAAKINEYRTKDRRSKPTGIEENKSVILEQGLSAVTGENIKSLSSI